jgi:ABC-type uncharacterized transport system substrate-binding protein
LALLAASIVGVTLVSLPAVAQQPSKTARVGWMSLATPTAPARNYEVFREAMRDLGYVEGKNLVLEPRYTGGTNELLVESAFDAMVVAKMQAVIVNAESLFYKGKDVIAKLAIAKRLPTCVWVKELADSGALMSYGVDQQAIARRTATYVDKILKGAKPGDIPVEQPTKFELIINRKTAKALGLTIPQSLLISADKVIE